jgi:NAD(P)-dependent dehydrogenase (short-subunit alcohol dehydrogenase family)
VAESLEQKVAIVTGGGSGIGEALCLELARRGARVVVADINGDDGGRVATAIVKDGGRATAARVDVSRETDVSRMVEQTAADYGRLDYLFNNAGIAIGGDARDLTLDHWRQVLDVDLYGVLHGMRAAYPIMARQGFGHIVNTSSAAAFLPDPGDALGQQAGGLNTATVNPEAGKPARSHPLSRLIEDRMLQGVAASGRDAADRRFPKKRDYI